MTDEFPIRLNDESEEQYKERMRVACIEESLKRNGYENNNALRVAEGLEPIYPIDDSLNGFIWDTNKLIKKKVFAQDIHKDFFYFGLLLPKNIDNEIKGKSYGKIQILKPCLITDNKKLIEINEKIKESMSLDFETLPSYLPQRWNLESIKDFLEGKTPEVKGKELFEKIKNQYEKYLYVKNPTWYKINSLWDIGTYFYMVFEAYPLFEKRGIAGTGKTKDMAISSFISFNGGEIMANPSESTLFRETEEVKGTKYFDEAEKLFVRNPKNNQIEGDVRTELINASYNKIARVPRQEKIGNKFITKWYSPYSPTQLASINGLFGATESRAITRICTKSTNSDKRGELEPLEDRSKPIWSEIRDELYRFALENWFEIKDIYNNFPKDCGLKRRELQIWKPLLAVAKHIDSKLYEEVLEFAKDLSEMRLDDLVPESSFDYMCLEALKRAIENYPETDKHYCDRIKDFYTGQKEDNDIYLNRNIAMHLKKLGFEKKRDNQKTYIIANKRTYDEIVAPICPQLAFLSTLSTLSTPYKVNEDKNSVDDVAISGDSVNRINNTLKISLSTPLIRKSVDGGDSVDVPRVESPCFNQTKYTEKELIKIMTESVKT